MKFMKAAGGYIRKKQDRYLVLTIPQFLGHSGFKGSRIGPGGSRIFAPGPPSGYGFP